jgi:Nucleotidyl transferase AbiEii toxin, Type IV TA system/Type I restriction enzyme R protein N terminus (HSDR_N)
VDFGFGDTLVAGPEEIEYPTILNGLPAPRLRAYSREASVAEKFETMVSLDTRNSRMKDFHDVWALSSAFAFDGRALQRAIAACFERRGTPLQAEVPRALTPAFYQTREIERRGALDVLRNGIKDSGCKFRLAYFRAASGLNEETRRLHAANLFSVVRQVHYSTRNERSLDFVLFLNGIPIFTAELKNPLTAQTVEDAIRQYKTDRDPREPLLAYGRCLAHFAVDPDLVYVTHPSRRAEDALPPLQPGQVRRCRQPPGAADAQGLRHGLLVGRNLGAR